MSIKVYPKPLSGHVHVIGSKSYAHRALIAASLAQGTSEIKNYPPSDDVHATIQALTSFGIQVQNDKVIGKSWLYKHSVIDCMASGSTLRFMIPLAMLQKEEVIFTGVKRLFERPLDVYEHLFTKEQFYIKNHQLIVKGPIEKTIFEVDGSKSSQFLTGLLFALPNLKHDTSIILTKPLQSASYIDITLDILKLANIEVKVDKQTYFIKGQQRFKPFSYEVEGDFSQAAFFMVAAVLGGKITLSNLNPHSKQGDRYIIDIIKNMGGIIEYDPALSHYTIYQSELSGIEIDLEDIPDLGPILMVLASVSKGSTVFKHVERLRYKESDRLNVMLDILQRVGIVYQLKEDELIIKGQKTLKGGQSFDTHGDHRIAMALAILSIKVDTPIIILDEHVVTKSYPNFFEVFKSIGGHYENT